ncbi:hypothetical protein [Chthonobacter rhizosphaerae]|uniref:hypothetical protein n=1 Tax=Chthonobacter rhizosphaerae TaxID=2735553 RepID=UPI0015EF7510|nr:hypothetical protein [Chthonobacter rhizosphaerae]
MEERNPRLDSRMEPVDARLEKLIDEVHALRVDVAQIRGAVGKYATAESVGYLKGRVDRLPTLGGVAMLAVGFLVLLVAAMHYDDIIALIQPASAVTP